MNIETVRICYFSGTGSTKKYALAFARELDCKVELVPVDVRVEAPTTAGPDELFVLCAPVYGGYVPPFVWEWLDGIQGTNTPAVLLAVFGARDYDNALLEMDAKLAERGFRTVAAAAVVARHSIVPDIAFNRPPEEDLHGVAAFAHRVLVHLGIWKNADDAPTFQFKGELGEPGPAFAPVVSSACTLCGTCARRCPTGAIPLDAPNTTDSESCAACLRCVSACPSGARALPEGLRDKIAALLSKAADPAKENEFFE